MKQRKKRPVPPPPPVVVQDPDEMKKKQDEEPEMPPMRSSFVDLEDPVYLERHAEAQTLQYQTAAEGFVLLKNSGVLPLTAKKANVFGRYAKDFISPELWMARGIAINRELWEFYAGYRTRDPGYTGSGWDEGSGTYTRQSRTSTGMFGNMGNLDHEPFIGYDVYNEDGSLRVQAVSSELLERSKAFSDTAVVVLRRTGGEGADHEKGDETLSEGEASMLSFTTEHFENVIVILACNSVIDGEFLVRDTEQRFYMYTCGGGVYSNNIGQEVLPDFDSRVELRYADKNGDPAPHIYPIRADRIGGVFYTTDRPGDMGGEALLALLTGEENPSGRLMDEIICDYDDNPVSRCYGGLTFPRSSTGDNRYIYGHNYVAYKEGVYLGYKYFETFCPERVVFPFGYGLSYSSFSWTAGKLCTVKNEYEELQFQTDVTVTNTGALPGRDVVEAYVMPPYYEDGPYDLEKPLVSLCAFEKTRLLQPGESKTVTLCWNARDVACWSDTAEHYVLEAGRYQFRIAANANAAHTAPAADLGWTLDEDMHFLADEVTGTPYRNLFTGSDADGWRYDAKGTEKENIVYLHRTDISGKPEVAPGTYPETHILDEITRETEQILDLEKRGLSSYFEMDGTDVHFRGDDIPVPVTGAVYRDKNGKQKNFMLQDVYAYLKDRTGGRYHDLSALTAETGIQAKEWSDDLVWDHFLDQFSVNEMMLRFYHSGFDIPSLLEYGIPRTFSADGPGTIGANNPVPMGRSTSYSDPVLACTWNKELCERFGYALAREVAASGESGTSWFYAPGNNLHRSCLSGKNNNYYSEDAHLAGWICGYFLKGMEEGGVNGCMKHFACNDQEVSREGLVVFSNEQALRENYFAAFEHALKISGGKGIMTSLGRVGTVNACGNTHLTVDLLRKEWGFDGMVITDGYGVTSYMYNINAMIGGHSGLLCFGNSGSFGECRDFMELYRYYLQYPGRTTAALREFFQGCCEGTMRSHTFRDLYADYDYYAGESGGVSTDLCWYEGRIGLGCVYEQAEELTYLGVELHEGESNPPSMMPNTNCKDRGGTIVLDDYGLRKLDLAVETGKTVCIPVTMEKCCGMQKLSFSVAFDKAAFTLERVKQTGLPGYSMTALETERGVDVTLETGENVFDTPCGTIFELLLTATGTAGDYPVSLLPRLDAAGIPTAAFLDKQGCEMSFALAEELTATEMTGGWSGVYQDVNAGGWYTEAVQNADELADVTLISGSIAIR